MDRGVIFSGAMVRALIDGRKRQTRRLATSPLRRVVAGDRLWVRESWQALSPGDYQPTRDPLYADLRYAATDPLATSDRDVRGYPWRPAIHTPRWASRLTLLVGRAWTEPLQAISREDCVAEGHPRADADLPEEVHLDAARDWYMDLWGTLHDKEGQRWSDNPLVVAIEFEVRAENIDRLQG